MAGLVLGITVAQTCPWLCMPNAYRTMKFCQFASVIDRLSCGMVVNGSHASGVWATDISQLRKPLRCFYLETCLSEVHVFKGKYFSMRLGEVLNLSHVSKPVDSFTWESVEKITKTCTCSPQPWASCVSYNKLTMQQVRKMTSAYRDKVWSMRREVHKTIAAGHAGGFCFQSVQVSRLQSCKLRRLCALFRLLGSPEFERLLFEHMVILGKPD